MTSSPTRFSLPVLDSISIATPCHADWDSMTPVDPSARVRHCASCDKNVYNLSEMTRADAEALLRAHEGRLCARLYRRDDGSVITADCPVGLAALRRRVVTGFTRAIAAVIAVAAMIGWARRDAWLDPVGATRPFDALTKALGRTPPYRVQIMGEICAPPALIPEPPPQALMGKLAPSSGETQ